MTPESYAAQKVRVRASAWLSRLFRNNVGAITFFCDKMKKKRFVRFGINNERKDDNKKMKSGDYIGLTPITITQEMVGKQVAVFTSIETKKAGFKVRQSYPKSSREFAQKTWIDFVLNLGGIAGFASDEKQLDTIFENFFSRVKNNDKVTTHQEEKRAPKFPAPPPRIK